MIIIDDMISSGDSMLEVATELKKRKAGKIFIASTFGLFTNGLAKFDEAYEKGIFDRILTTNLTYQTPELLEKPYYMDENGEKVEYEDTIYINEESIPIPTMSQEQLDEFVAFIESVDKKTYYNEAVMNIINEEAAAFFEGQKSAADVAGIIQSRVQIYVNENM